MYPVGLSSCSKTADASFFEDCAAAGIAAIEVSPAQGHYDEVDFPAIRRFASDADVCLWSFHLPFMPFLSIDISSLNKSLRRRSVAYNAELIRKAADIGITKYVIHPSGEPILMKRGERMKASQDSLSVLAAVAAECGGELAVEDLPRTCLGRDSGEILTLLEADDRLRVCFDTNHLLKESIADFIRNVGDKIITTHISDYDFIDEKHWLPGEGKINWQSLLAALQRTGYRGVWLYELGYKSPRSLSRPRDLTPADYVRNANEIFLNEPITVLAERCAAQRAPTATDAERLT